MLLYIRQKYCTEMVLIRCTIYCLNKTIVTNLCIESERGTYVAYITGFSWYCSDTITAQVSTIKGIRRTRFMSQRHLQMPLSCLKDICRCRLDIRVCLGRLTFFREIKYCVQFSDQMILLTKGEVFFANWGN